MRIMEIAKKIDDLIEFLNTKKNGTKRISHPQYANRRMELDYIQSFLNIQPLTKVVDYGCGSAPYSYLSSENWIKVDIEKKSEDVIQITESHFDQIGLKYSHFLCTSVLEHVKDLNMFMKNFESEVPKNTICLFTVPFLVHQHGAPEDYRRLTIFGLKELFSNQEILKIDTLYEFGFCISNMMTIQIDWLLRSSKIFQFTRISLFPIWMILYALIHSVGMFFDLVSRFSKKQSIFYNSSVIIFRKIN